MKSSQSPTSKSLLVFKKVKDLFFLIRLTENPLAKFRPLTSVRVKVPSLTINNPYNCPSSLFLKTQNNPSLAIVPSAFPQVPYTSRDILRRERPTFNGNSNFFTAQLSSARQFWLPTQQQASAKIQTCQEVYSNRAGPRGRKGNTLAREEVL